MDAFKRRLKIRIAWLGAALLGIAVTYFILLLLDERLALAPATLPVFRREFTLGAFIGLIAVVLVHMIKTLSALRSETVLKERYIRENDERRLLVMRKTGSLGFQISGVGLGFAAVVAGFFDLTVLFSLMGAIFFLLIVKFTLWLYYERKY